MTASDHLGEQFRIRTKVARGYELPGWHQPDHTSLSSAQGEVTKLRQWDSDRTAIKDVVIKDVTPARRPVRSGPHHAAI